MHVLVLGGGIVGVTTAYFLQRDGHEVTLVERHPAAAAETSFANAGMIAPGHAYTWASPRAPGMLLRSLWRDDQALKLRLRADPQLLSWGLRFLANCTTAAARRNTARKVRLCLYSQDLLHQVVAETGVAYDARSGGLLYLYRSPQTLAGGIARMSVLVDNGLKLEAIGPDRIGRIDPALAPVAGQFAGALYCPSDESGDANLFSRALAGHCAAGGARLLFHTSIDRIEADGDRIAAVHTSAGRLVADRYVMALGCQAAAMARPLGTRLPIYPVKGYSITVPTAGRNDAPRIGGIDEERLIAYTPMGDRLRVTATADFAGYDTSHRPGDFSGMTQVARSLFPNAADWSSPSYWAGLRPMTPEGTPIFGTGRHRNLFYNAGHGHMGWTMSCASAQITADLIAGRPPAVPLDGMLVA